MSVKKLAVPDANTGNTLVLHESEMGCCPGNHETCKYVAAVSPGDGVTNVTAITIVVNGINTTLTFDAAANTPKEVRVAVAKALRSAGYDPYYEDSYKGIQVIYGGDELHIIGEVVPVSAVIDGNTVNFVKRCTMASVCESSFTVALDTQVGVVSYDGTVGATAIGGAPGFATGNEDALNTAIRNAMTTDGFAFVAVTVEETGGAFDVRIHAPGQVAIALGVIDGLLTRCYPDFIA